MISRSDLYPMNVGLAERDINYLDIDSFVFSDPFERKIITKNYIGRPDMISYDFYRTVNYWWIIMRLNGIEDIWNDIEEGIVIRLPSAKDIERLLQHLTANTR